MAELTRDGEKSKKEELYLGAMSIMAAADGTISPVETTMIRSLASAIPELEEAELTTLIPNATVAIRSASDHPEWVRKKAFVLGVEVVTRGNEAAYEDGDANLRGIGMLQRCLSLPDTFINAALSVVGYKYVGGEVDASVLETVVDAMLYVATASRTSIARLRRVANILEMVPQLGGREIMSLFHVPRLIAGKPLPMFEKSGTSVLTERLAKLPKDQQHVVDKTFVLACEAAIALGMDPKTSAALSVVEQALELSTKDLATAARETWSAKYASAPWTGFGAG